MAEFIDVIHTIQRICKKNDGHCSVCMLDEFACPNNVRFDKTEEAAFRELEDAVVKWAEENPEQVYPTWGEYLEKVIPHGSNETTLSFAIYAMQQSIPADIAQKLEIEPKEG